MLQLPAGFLEGEVRDGFYVNGMMKRAWASQLEVLADVDALCTKYGLRYMADWGTLLGTVRHGGYIPWDDDFDIGMPRADYMRFLEVSGELGGSYHILCIHTQEEYRELIGRVVNHHSISMEPAHLEKFHGCPFALGIDIFPYDYLYRDEEKEADRKRRVKIIVDLIGVLEGMKQVTREAKDAIRQAERMMGHKILGTGHLRNALYHCLEELFSECPEEEAGAIADFQNHLNKDGKYFLPKDTFERLIAMDYEFVKVPVPANYEEILRIKYRDFLNPVRSWSSHEFPYYRGQLEVLQEHRPDFFPGYDAGKEGVLDSRAETVPCGEILFLPHKASEWGAMEPFWEEARKDPKNDVYVIPIPYYEKEWDGRRSRLHYERELFPERVGAAGLDEYDFAGRHPAVLFFQSPEDNFGEALTVPEMFYTDRLREMTDCLALIAPKGLDAPSRQDERGWENMKYYAVLPGVLRSDLVYVPSEEMREAYVGRLTELCGAEAENTLRRKIRVAPNRGGGAETASAKEKAPAEWRERLLGEGGAFRKALLYQPTAGAMAEYGARMLEKMRSALETFRENADHVTVLLRMAPDLETAVLASPPEVQEELLGLLEDFVSKGWGIFDPSPDSALAVEICDAYYGGAAKEIRELVRAGKPVMIENPEIGE